MRYRAQARADLYEVYRVSLAELIIQRRLVELADLLSQLPQASRFWAAMMDDEEYAEMVAEASLYTDEDEEDPQTWAPSFRDYSATYALLTQIHDSIGANTYTVAATNGGKPKKPKPFPQPRTAIDRAQQDAQVGVANDMLGMLNLPSLNSGPKVKPSPLEQIQVEDNQ